MVLQEHQINGITSLLTGIGVVIFSMGIFLSEVDFSVGLIVAIMFWGMAGILKGWIVFENEHPIFRTKTTILHFVTFLSVLIVLLSIFFDIIPFNVALIIVIAIWALTHSLSQFFAVDADPTSTPTPSSSTATFSLSGEGEREGKEEPAKSFCSNCNSTIDKEAIFCHVCGYKLRS
jgi:hypothetical protein